jgi:hypothetical protein
MSYVITSEKDLNQTTAPRLPVATNEYDPNYINQLNNVLRLYFNQIDNILGQMKGALIIPSLTNYTVATLPSAVTSGKGARAFVTNALTPTFGATVVAGGAVAVPVYSDGTNWKVG